MVPSEKAGCIMEIKYAEDGAFETACNQALKQMDHGGYASVLKQEGMHTIHKFAIACYKKSCKVVSFSDKK